MRNKYPTLILIGIALVIVLSAGILIYYEGHDAGVDSALERNADGENGYNNGYREGYEAAVADVEAEVERRYGEIFIFDW